jgi:tRNA (guanosine-2'-O-)-methyltransferase
LPRALASSFALAALSCGGALDGPSAPRAQRVDVQTATGPGGAPLSAACTPTGPESCFNAIDDNCNGVIDEGCGVATGVVQFVIAWGDSPADVDLLVTAPNGERAYDANRSTASGLHFDRDCPGEDCHGQNIEYVWFDALDPPRGRWTVDVHLGDLRGAPLPVHVRLGARLGSRIFGAEVLLEKSEDRKTFTFVL